jgi:hypothetical protein
MFGNEKFQGMITDWFKILKLKETSSNNYDNSSLISGLIESHVNNLKNKKQELSILNVLEQVIYNF